MFRPWRGALSGGLAVAMLASAAFLAVAWPASTESASAEPEGATLSALSAIETQLATQDQRVSALDEQYDQAEIALQQAQQLAFVASVERARAKAAAEEARQRLEQDAIDAYVSDAPTIELGSLLTGPAIKSETKKVYAESIAETQSHLLAQYESAQAQLQQVQSVYEARAQSAADEAASAHLAAESAQATSDQLESTMSQLKGQLATEVATEEATVATQEASKAQALAQPASGTAGAGAPARTAAQAGAYASVQKASQAASIASQVASSSGDNPEVSRAAATANAAVSQAASTVQPPQTRSAVVSAPSASGGQAAVLAAERYLGVPYVYGGASSSGVDCSGLTMGAWGAAGVPLAHSAAEQYDETTHVSMSDLEPGDLLFYNFGGGIDHVVMYVGNGTVIQAAHTGTDVSFSPIWYFDLVGAGRP